MKKIIHLVLFSFLLISCSSDGEDQSAVLEDRYVLYEGIVKEIKVNYVNPENSYSTETTLGRRVKITGGNEYFDTMGGYKMLENRSLKYSFEGYNGFPFNNNPVQGREVELEISISGNEMSYNSIEYERIEGDDKRYSSKQHIGILYKVD